MTTPQEHAQLYRELVGEIESFYCGPVPVMCPALIARARQAAEEIDERKTPPQIPVEIEGRRVPSDEEIENLANAHGLLQWAGDIGETVVVDYAKLARAVLARFGGGEGES